MDPKLKEAGWEKYAEFKVRISYSSNHTFGKKIIIL